MKSRVRILHLEHSRLDRDLVQDALTKVVGFDHLLIPATSKAELIAELSWGTFDIILCDSSLPVLNGQDALRMVRKKMPDDSISLRYGELLVRSSLPFGQSGCCGRNLQVRSHLVG
jgi:CheY-like chemotaxis protein